MRIALVFVPVLLETNWTSVPAQDRNMGRVPPLSLCYVAAAAEKAGHTVTIIDAAAENLTPETAAERLKAFRPDLAGFTLTTYGLHQTLSWIRELKRLTGVPVIAGGIHLSLYPEETMSHRELDYALIGEAEQSLAFALEAIASGKLSAPVPGLAYRRDGRVVVTPPSGALPPIDSVPFPARHLLKPGLYYNILSRRRNFTAVLSARGCPFRCSFCDLTSKPFRMRSPESFVGEIEEARSKFGITEFDIYDSSFTADRSRALKICEMLSVRAPGIVWTARTRVDTVDRELLRAMKKAGCDTVMYGIESSDPGIQKQLGKEIDPERIRKTVAWTAGEGVRTLGFFMIGSPGETQATARATIKFSLGLGLDYAQFTRTMPLPGSAMYARLLSAGLPDFWRIFTLTGAMPSELPVPGTDMTPSEAKALVLEAYRRFYFRPSYMLKSLSKIGSLLELKNKALAAVSLLRG